MGPTAAPPLLGIRDLVGSRSPVVAGPHSPGRSCADYDERIAVALSRAGSLPVDTSAAVSGA